MNYFLRGILAIGITVGLNVLLENIGDPEFQLAIAPLVGAALISGGVTGISGFLGAGASRRAASSRREELEFRRQQVANRQAEISRFREELAQRRAEFGNRFSALQDLAFKRFVPQTEAQFAGRGLQVTGGAFQSELAKRVADLQAQQEVALSNRARADLLAEQSARAGAAQLIPSTFDPRAGDVDAAQAGAFGRFFGQNLPGTLESFGRLGSALLQRRRPRSITRTGVTQLRPGGGTQIGDVIDLTRVPRSNISFEQ